MSTNKNLQEGGTDPEALQREPGTPQPESTQWHKTGDLAQFALCSGISLAVLNALQQAHGLPGFPDFWYRNRMSWWALSFFLIAIGAYALRPGQSDETTPNHDEQGDFDQPTQPHTRPVESARHVIRVFSRPACSLCDEAIETLREQFGPSADITVVNIEAPEFDPALVASYSLQIPVVEINGVVRFRGRVDPRLLARFIAGEAGRLL